MAVVVKPGEVLSLSIEKPAAGGRMIARADGHIVLVSGTIPGEHARVRIERVAKGVAFGEAIEIEEASPDRRAAFADPACGGNLYAHIDYSRQLALKSQVIADALRRIAQLEWGSSIQVFPSPEEGYRMRARLHLRGRRTGFFREGSHEICDARPTRQLLSSSCDVLDAVAAQLELAGIVTELELSENLDASERVIHIETAQPVEARALAEVAQIAGLTGVTASQARGGTLHAAVIGGDPYVHDVVRIEGREVSLGRHVLAFFQGNRFLLKDLVSRVVSLIAHGEDVIDLYAGVGLFSVAAAVCRDARVTAVEGDHIAAADLAGNAGPVAGAVATLHQPVEDFLAPHRVPPAVLIVDPPRTGLSKDALRGAVRLAAGRIIYVSCDVATFARDARRLVDAGYRVETIDAFDLFPNTPHVETVAVFSRTADASRSS